MNQRGWNVDKKRRAPKAVWGKVWVESKYLNEWCEWDNELWQTEMMKAMIKCNNLK